MSLQPCLGVVTTVDVVRVQTDRSERLVDPLYNDPMRRRGWILFIDPLVIVGSVLGTARTPAHAETELAPR